MKKLDPNSKTPLHVQLSDLLRADILQRQLLPGEAVPTELQLQTSYQVSRSVARQALSTLVTEGLIVRGRGRGSVVAHEKRYHRLVHRLAGLSSQVESSGVNSATTVLSLELVAQQPHTQILGGKQVYQLERVRSIDGTPVAVIKTWLPEWLGSGLSSANLSDYSLHARLRELHGLQLSSGVRQVRAVGATEQIAQLLKLDVGAPLLVLEGNTADSSGKISEVFVTWHRGDQIAFDIEVSEASAGPYHSNRKDLPATSTDRKLNAIGSEPQKRALELAKQLVAELSNE